MRSREARIGLATRRERGMQGPSQRRGSPGSHPGWTWPTRWQHRIAGANRRPWRSTRLGRRPWTRRGQRVPYQPRKCARRSVGAQRRQATNGRRACFARANNWSSLMPGLRPSRSLRARKTRRAGAGDCGRPCARYALARVVCDATLASLSEASGPGNGFPQEGTFPRRGF